MPRLEVFFDPTCPFCYRGHGYLMELSKDFPAVEIALRPVEAHPHAEEPWHRPRVDLAIQGALFLRAKGGGEIEYCERVYRAFFVDHMNVEDIDVLVGCAPGDLASEFAGALRERAYEKELMEANEYAYRHNGVWEVPTFVCGAKRLDAVRGVGVTKAQLRALFAAVAA